MNEPDEGVDVLPMWEARGLRWVLFPSLIGLLLGAAVVAARQIAWIDFDALTHGALVGAALGGTAGAFFWAFFPYKPLPTGPKDKAPTL